MHGVDFYLMHLFIDIIIEWVLSHYYYYDSGIVETALGNLNEGTQDYYFLWGGGGATSHHIAGGSAGGGSALSRTEHEDLPPL